ncbi:MULTISPECIES: universal stress protein [Streptomyces]|uniref:Nucleotide-binding universal stress UspA family protein n=3 Tax=Streptomyces TaxID=1883 RepID=A0AA40SD70_9ACTN|nr:MULTISPECIES: universal stress protein [Streptomyces]MBA8944257.1 nucleotide-binding universal stress UspA family protein [Streptomyces calvus]MBA8976619.1 nucleotide-binding universal stress UspA family protein [Streptomyces calvus]MYS26968.1 universal stress protein [Streptomyces sp. SID7804]GGP54295.1 universal stress protein [Streptomyces calvus]GGS54107.1 universal stress protein [Streptomyces rubiginosus]
MQSSEVPRVVVGVDGSPSSYAALRWADRYARGVGGAVEAVCVWDTPSSRGWSGPAIDPEFDLGQARERFAQELHAVFPDGPPAGLTEHLVEGDPSEVLIRASEGAALLVVGRRGRGGFARAVLGSVSQRCAQHAACPVVVVRQEDDPAR